MYSYLIQYIFIFLSSHSRDDEQRFLSINYLWRGISRTHGYHFHIWSHSSSISCTISYSFLLFVLDVARSNKSNEDGLKSFRHHRRYQKLSFPLFRAKLCAHAFFHITITKCTIKMFLYHLIKSVHEQPYDRSNCKL